ncbi:MAG TPA: quinolinate synthase NadA [bacterium]|nr:quinolinate synthase NadA [bacterium]
MKVDTAVDRKSDVLAEMAQLKRAENAAFLVHNYQIAEVQDIGDFVGDSLGLAQVAAQTDADLIVLCGVRFMAETAKLLNPEKTVLLPEQDANCPMAQMVRPGDVLALKGEHPDAVVVSYVNTTAATKAVTDICCTSANAVKVVSSIPEDREIIFTPDQHLGAYVHKMTGRDLIIWPGCCPTHARVTAEMVLEAKGEHPGAKVVVHPECPMEVIELADAVRSTSGMLKYCAESDASDFIIGTEKGMLYPLKKRCPEKNFWPVAEETVCPNMKLTKLESVRDALKNTQYEITIPPDIAEPARRAIDRMMEIGRESGN